MLRRSGIVNLAIVVSEDFTNHNNSKLLYVSPRRSDIGLFFFHKLLRTCAFCLLSWNLKYRFEAAYRGSMLRVSPLMGPLDHSSLPDVMLYQRGSISSGLLVQEYFVVLFIVIKVRGQEQEMLPQPQRSWVSSNQALTSGEVVNDMWRMYMLRTALALRLGSTLDKPKQRSSLTDAGKWDPRKAPVFESFSIHEKYWVKISDHMHQHSFGDDNCTNWWWQSWCPLKSTVRWGRYSLRVAMLRRLIMAYFMGTGLRTTKVQPNKNDTEEINRSRFDANTIRNNEHPIFDSALLARRAENLYTSIIIWS